MDHSSDQLDLESGFKVGECMAEPQLQRISTQTGEVRVEPKVMEVLVLLAAYQGKTVTKDRFMDEVWAGSIVTGDALLRCISELRRIFEDDPREPRYIETIRKKGYRLIAPVAPLAEVPHLGMATSPLPRETAVVPDVTGPETNGSNVPDQPSSNVKRFVFRSPWSLRVGMLAVSLLLMVVVVSLLVRVSTSTVLPLTSVPLTTLLGEENDPNLSPDGRRITFVWNQGDQGNSDIYVKQVGDEALLRLTKHEGEDRSPSWSPDGQQIVYIRSVGLRHTVHLVSAYGGPERLLLELGEREVESVAWSPDGNAIALSLESEPHGPFGIHLFDLEQRILRTLTVPPVDYRGDFMLTFSPDGSMIAFVRSVVDKVDDIFLTGTHGGELKRLTNDRSEISGLDWSGDGKNLVFTSDRLGSSALWRIPLSGGKPEWIPTAGEGSGIHQPSIARSAGRLAFVQRIQETNIWTSRLDSSLGADGSPFITSTRWDSHPTYSPDGSKIAFVSNRSGSYEIWMGSSDGSNLVRLTSFGGPFTQFPRWSPDNRMIAFSAFAEGSADIYVVGTDTSKPRRFTTSDYNDRAPSWSRDGQWIYFSSNRSGNWQIWKKSIDEVELVQVTTDGGFAGMESYDGRYIYYVKRLVPGIWRMPVEGGPEENMIQDVQPFDWGNWTINERGLYFLRRTPESTSLILHDLDSGEEREVATLSATPRHPAMAISPDGSTVLYTRIDRIGSDILLVEGFH